ncbi:cbb3-type cytochrome oxidase subunit 3 [Chryseobacterium taklimakanense]
MLFFIGLIIYVFNKPKKHYDEAAHTPLEDDEKPFNL